MPESCVSVGRLGGLVTAQRRAFLFPLSYDACIWAVGGTIG